ncbi:hypothetical protein FGG08_000545 [Glutinoglossum americanum]|uniref:Uncharacterized protein n=1 Tax=Glutinoglossum americanum TaxID=1670608 RepID=A0A9P8I8T9_9PEZI|nr:hypothetical protein FGG08_000545 [Glutinoglossum americanum]
MSIWRLLRLLAALRKAQVLARGGVSSDVQYKELQRFVEEFEPVELPYEGVVYLHTYVGCTARENDTVVEKCVVATAPRINFVPIGFQVNSNGNACPQPSETIAALVRWSIIEWLIFLLGNTPLMKRLWQRARGKSAEELRSKQFRVNILGFWTSLGLDVGEIVIVGTLLSKVGYQVDIFKEFVIWSVRPRSAFLNGVLGAIDGGWSNEAVTDMVANILLSIFGGYLAFFGALCANHTTNPMRPLVWKTYMAGGFMASISTDVVWLSFSFMCILATFCCWKALAPPFRLIFKVLWFAVSSPFIQAKVFLKNGYLRMRGRKDQREKYLALSLDNSSLMVWYYSALALCFVLFVGNWMFWTGFLQLSGELYCPGELSKFDLVVIGLIFARTLIRQTLLHV